MLELGSSRGKQEAAAALHALCAVGDGMKFGADSDSTKLAPSLFEAAPNPTQSCPRHRARGRLRAAGEAAGRGHAQGEGAEPGHAVAGEVLPLPVFPYRRVRIQQDQGRGKVRIQVHCISVPLLLIIRLYMLKIRFFFF